MYLIDTNVLVEAKNRYYAFDICPGFWQWVEASHEMARIYSVAKVREELDVGGDDLWNWVRNLPDGFFLDVSGGDLGPLQRLSRWVNESDYTSAAKAEFLGAADYYLVAQAKTRGFTVISQEKWSDGTRKIKIPNAAVEMGVEVLNTFEVMRREDAVLGYVS